MKDEERTFGGLDLAGWNAISLPSSIHSPFLY